MMDITGEATEIMTITLNTLIPTMVATLTTMQRPPQLVEVGEGEVISCCDLLLLRNALV